MPLNFGKRIGDLDATTSVALSDEMELSLAGSAGSRRITFQNFVYAIVALFGLYMVRPGETGVTNRFYPYGHVQRYGTITKNSAGAAATNAATINAALSAVATDGGTVILPEGVIYTNVTLMFQRDRTRLVGQGNGTQIIYTGSGTIIDLNGKYFPTCEDFCIASTTAAIGIDVGDVCHYFRLKRIIASGDSGSATIAGFTTAAFYYERSYYGYTEHCEANYCTRGFYGIRECNGNTWAGCITRQCLRGYHITDLTSNSDGCNILGGEVESDQASTVAGIEVDGADNMVLSGIRLEVNYGAHIYIRAGATAALKNQIAQCTCVGAAPTIVLGGTGADNSSSVISTHIVGGSGSTGITVNNDCLYTRIEAAPAAYASLTDNGYGSIVLIDPGGGLWYARSFATKTNNGFQLFVGGAVTKIDFNGNTGQIDFDTLASAFGFSAPSVGGTPTALLRLGGNYLWFDASNKLRTLNSIPTSLTDGTVVGTQS